MLDLTQDLEIKAGADYTYTLQYTTDGTTPINITGYTVIELAGYREFSDMDGNPLFTSNGTITDAANGFATVTITAAQTAVQGAIYFGSDDDRINGIFVFSWINASGKSDNARGNLILYRT